MQADPSGWANIGKSTWLSKLGLFDVVSAFNDRTRRIYAAIKMRRDCLEDDTDFEDNNEGFC